MDLKKLENKPIGNAMRSIEGKKICLLGWGLENQALAKFLLSEKINCEITICDAKIKKLSLPKIQTRLGKNYDKKLTDFDIIFRSPGYPLFSPALKKAKQADTIISSPMNLFFELCPTKNIIGVTGTKGKGTTASLIYHILKTAKKKTFLGGNIGIAPFSFINKIKKTDWVVLELSSFQLEDLNYSPKFSVITNFYKEHLAPADSNNPNYHKTLSNYQKAKLNILKYQARNNTAILNKKISGKAWQLGKSKKIYFTKSNLQSKLLGAHNKENIAAASLLAQQIKIKPAIIKEAVASFRGLEYRLEYVSKKKNINYYNDSFSTTPENTIAAIKSFSSPIVLLAGGADKGSNFLQLAKEIKNQVKFVILFKGKGSVKINQSLNKLKYPKEKIRTVSNMPIAIKTAKQQAKNGDIVLLSPGCASFGLFKNYKQRGKLFKTYAK